MNALATFRGLSPRRRLVAAALALSLAGSGIASMAMLSDQINDTWNASAVGINLKLNDADAALTFDATFLDENTIVFQPVKVSNTGTAKVSYYVNSVPGTGDEPFAQKIDVKFYTGGTCAAAPTGTAWGATTMTLYNASIQPQMAHTLAAGASENVCIWAKPKAGSTFAGSETYSKVFTFQGTYAP